MRALHQACLALIALVMGIATATARAEVVIAKPKASVPNKPPTSSCAKSPMRQTARSSYPSIRTRDPRYVTTSIKSPAEKPLLK
jgi:hypothetical protein